MEDSDNQNMEDLSVELVKALKGLNESSSHNSGSLSSIAISLSRIEMCIDRITDILAKDRRH